MYLFKLAFSPDRCPGVGLLDRMVALFLPLESYSLTALITTHAHTYMHPHAYSHMHTCINTWTLMDTHSYMHIICVRTCLHAWTHMHTCIHMHIQMQTYMNTHAHTHTCTHSLCSHPTTHSPDALALHTSGSLPISTGLAATFFYPLAQKPTRLLNAQLLKRTEWLSFLGSG